MRNLSNYLLISLIPWFFQTRTIAQDLDFFEPTTTLGGYGELHYNNTRKDGDEKWKHVLDFHRFVIFFGHAWTEKWSFRAEVELEHNFVKDGQGELELEQAYINYHHSNYFGAQAGVVLVSAGLTNEYHEPPHFLGVERPEYSKVIIPTTWYGNGASVYGNPGKIEYRVVVMEGLNSDNFSPGSGIRGGRQKGFKVDAEHLLYNARIDYLGVAGLRFGGSYIYNNAKGDSTEISVNLIEFHAQYQANNIYAVFEIGNISYDHYEIESSFGYYFDLGYNLGSLFQIESRIVPFFRYTNINTAAQTKPGGGTEKKYHTTQWLAGFNYNPIDQVVFKIDFGEQCQEWGNVTTKMYNLGIGYWF
jgi:hypothetical protein